MSRSRVTKYHFQRHDGQRLLLESSFSGAILLLLAASIEVIFKFNGWCPHDQHLEQVVAGLLTHSDFVKEFKYLGINLLSLLFGIFFTFIPNPFIDPQKAIIKAIDKNQDELELLIKKSWMSTFPKKFKSKGIINLAITLNSGKVYVGYATELPIPSKTNFISLLPFFSGYRSNETKKLIFTTEYIDMYEDSMIHDFLLLLPVSEIVSVNIFDFKAYQKFASNNNVKLVA